LFNQGIANYIAISCSISVECAEYGHIEKSDHRYRLHHPSTRSPCNANVGSAPRPFATWEKVALLVLATDATWCDTGATTTSVVCRTQELVALRVFAHNRSRTSALGVHRDRVGQTIPVATFASRSQARVAAASVPCTTHEIVAHTLAACVSGGCAKIAAACAALATQERLTMRVGAMHGFVAACSAHCNRIRVFPSLVTALATFPSTTIATTRATTTARELVPVGVRAAKTTLGLASIATALPSSTGERKAIIIVASLNKKLGEPLCEVDVLPAPHAQHGALLVQAFAI